MTWNLTNAPVIVIFPKYIQTIWQTMPLKNGNNFHCQSNPNFTKVVLTKVAEVNAKLQLRYSTTFAFIFWRWICTKPVKPSDKVWDVKVQHARTPAQTQIRKFQGNKCPVPNFRKSQPLSVIFVQKWTSLRKDNPISEPPPPTDPCFPFGSQAPRRRRSGCSTPWTSAL